MDQALFEKVLKMMNSKNDSDAVMGLRSMQNFFQSENSSLDDALRFAIGAIEQFQRKPAGSNATAAATAAAAPVRGAVANISGMPECRNPRPGVIEVVSPGKSEGESYQLPGESARHANIIATHLKDAVVAAIVNKSRFRLKLNDIKNANDEVVETILQAEYDRHGMSPVRIWANNRGEVGALATVLRKAVSQSFPDLVT